jgi:myo-inositol 2-dehydrogenase/D-chiro-inositol 1-dehydrogenase
MGQTHLRALHASTRARVVAIAEPAAGTRATLDAPGVTIHSGLDAMLDAGGLDGVLVAAPSDRHLAAVERLAAAGLPILCEKPCGVTAEQARAAARIATRSGIKLQVAYWRRFVPALRDLRYRMLNGDMGGLYFVACHQWDGAPPPVSFRARSGGIFIDMGVHEFDQLRWLTGQEITALHTVASNVPGEDKVPGDAESAQALCALSAGSAGLVALGRRFPAGDICRVEVFGTSGAEDCRFLGPPDGDAVFLHALCAQAEGFIDLVDGKPAQGATAEDAVAALTAAEQASRVLAGRE